MTNDLRAAAAERVRRVQSGETVLEVYTPNDSDWYIACIRYQNDRNLLSNAYVQEHPPDGETEIDEAWLRAVGAIKEDHPQKWTFRRSDALDIGLWHVDDGWKAMLIHTPHAASCIVRGLKTRSDLRGLCAALGISLGEGK